MFDDLCGKFTLNQNYFEDWKKYIGTIELLFKDACCKFIATCRLQVFLDDRLRNLTLFKGNECHIGSDRKSVV